MHLDLRSTAVKTSSLLHNISNVELGLHKVQALFDQMHCPHAHDNASDVFKEPPSFVYHRLDYLTSPPKVCKYFKQLATLDTSSLFLSSASFKSPIRFISDDEYDMSMAIQRFVAYINDHTKLLSNPGLKVIMQMAAWKRAHSLVCL